MRREIAKGILVLILFFCNAVFAADYRVLVIPDNVAKKPSVDAFIYEDSAEFFANQVINKLNLSQTVESPTVSEVRDKLWKNPRLLLSTRDALLRFQKGYNIDYLNVKKLAAMFNTNKVLLVTSSADAQNYFMKRTFWDFMNIPGASVVDPAIKISTYAVLIDTDRDVNLWEDTFYRTISSCENRMVANSMGPQTQQLEKIRDYSRMLGPQIASNVQAKVVPASMVTRANIITYGPKDFDNVFTKKYRWYKHGAREIVRESDNKFKDYRQWQYENGIETFPDKCKRLNTEYRQKISEIKAERAQAKAENTRLKQEQKQLKLEEQQKHIQDVSNKKQSVKEKEINVVDIKEQQPKQKNPKKIKHKKTDNQNSETKIINISKEEILQTEPQGEIKELELKYYQPKSRNVPEIKNTTINDI